MALFFDKCGLTVASSIDSTTGDKAVQDMDTCGLNNGVNYSTVAFNWVISQIRSREVLILEETKDKEEEVLTMSKLTWKTNPYALDENFPYKKAADDYVVKEIKMFKNKV